MKNPILITILSAALFGCTTLTTQQQADITNAEQTLAKAAQIAAPLVPNAKLSNDLYALATVATAYGSQPVPTTVAQATALVPQTAAVVLPLITGTANGAKIQTIINGAAAILSGVTTSGSQANP